jgi:DNA recombination-dependent growth factor C
MPLLSGAMGCRRYRVLNGPEHPDRDAWLNALSEHSFRQPPSAAKGGENLGWVNLRNLCVTEFDLNSCFYGQYFVWSLRIDNKRIPGKLLKALLDLRMQEWLSETGRERVPAKVKAEMKDQLELELFPRQLPSVAVHDICWDMKDHLLRFFTNSNKANETFRVLFSQTFGLETRSLGPVDVAVLNRRDDAWLERLDVIGHSDYRPREER